MQPIYLSFFNLFILKLQMVNYNCIVCFASTSVKAKMRTVPGSVYPSFHSAMLEVGFPCSPLAELCQGCYAFVTVNHKRSGIIYLQSRIDKVQNRRPSFTRNEMPSSQNDAQSNQPNYEPQLVMDSQISLQSSLPSVSIDFVITHIFGYIIILSLIHLIHRIVLCLRLVVPQKIRNYLNLRHLCSQMTLWYPL